MNPADHPLVKSFLEYLEEELKAKFPGHFGKLEVVYFDPSRQLRFRYDAPIEHDFKAEYSLNPATMPPEPPAAQLDLARYIANQFFRAYEEYNAR